MVTKLNSPFYSLFNIADCLLAIEKISWGSVVAVYSFAFLLADKSEKMNSNKIFSLCEYITIKVGIWILDNDGWETFAEYFHEFVDKIHIHYSQETFISFSKRTVFLNLPSLCPSVIIGFLSLIHN